MKKTWIILLSACMAACNNGSSTDKATNGSDTGTTAGTAADNAGQSTGSTTLPPGITQADVDKGLNLVATSDCTTCHQINAKVTGPSYADVANKYEATKENIAMLADKVVKGGTGVWGQVPMLPHDGLPQEDAVAMVKYVLSLKTRK
jgi:cytochrome c